MYGWLMDDLQKITLILNWEHLKHILPIIYKWFKCWEALIMLKFAFH